MAELLFKEEVYALVGAAMEVCNILGPGFFEPVYQEAYGIELAERKIPFAAQEELRIWYKGRELDKKIHCRFRRVRKSNHRDQGS